MNEVRIKVQLIRTLLKEIIMYGLGRTTNYNIFKCLSPECNKNIPVESFLSHNNYSTGISYLQKEGIDLRHDLIAIDVTCPFCSHTNHFRVMDRVREISKQEYDAQSDAVKSNSSRIKVVYKVKTQTDSAVPALLQVPTLLQEYPP
jgi:ABC-type taurine transport system substrate-binding protein